MTIAEGSWFEALPDATPFDVIVSNPPYVADASVEIEHIVSDWEPSAALFAGPDGLDDLRTIIARSAFGRLRPNGWLVLEHGHDQGDAVRELMAAAGLVDTETQLDLAGLDRVSLGRRPSHLFDVAWDAGDLAVRHLHNTVSDYAHLLRWLTTPEVLEWYEGRDTTFDLAAVLAEYGPGGEHERDGTIPAIIELDGDPIGYVQLYELDDPGDAAAFDLDDGRGVWSLDLYLGRPELFGHGIGRAVCRAAAEHFIAERRCPRRRDPAVRRERAGDRRVPRRRVRRRSRRARTRTARGRRCATPSGSTTADDAQCRVISAVRRSIVRSATAAPFVQRIRSVPAGESTNSKSPSNAGSVARQRSISSSSRTTGRASAASTSASV